MNERRSVDQLIFFDDTRSLRYMKTQWKDFSILKLSPRRPINAGV